MYKSDEERNPIAGLNPNEGEQTHTDLASDLAESIDKAGQSVRIVEANEIPQLDHTLSERIDTAVNAGIQRGQAEAVRRHMRIRRRIGGAAAACLVLFACAFTIRESPAFAALVRDIPGFERFVDLIRSTQDQGIRLALDNDFVQPVGVSDEHEGMKLTVQGIIVDDSRMVLFYEVKLPDKEHNVQFDKPALTDITGKHLSAMVSFRYPEEEKQDVRKAGLQRGTVDFNLTQDTILPDEVILSAKLILVELPNTAERPMQLAGSDSVPEAVGQSAEGVDFEVRFRIDRDKFAGLRHEYVLNQTIDMEGQKITFAKAVVSPLQVSLYLDYDAENSKQIFGPGDIRLVDDKGTEWKQFSGSLVKDHPVYHFESPYFNKPKSLNIEGSWFRALDRDKMKVTVDTVKGEVLQSPDDKLMLHDVVRGEVDTKLDFELKDVNEEDKMMYSLFEQEFQDADGRTYTMSERGGVRTTTSFEASNRNLQHVYYYIDKTAYKQPLTFTLFSYPQYIRQPYSILVK